MATKIPLVYSDGKHEEINSNDKLDANSINISKKKGNIITIDTDGLYAEAPSSGSGGTSGDYLPLTGGNVDALTINDEKVMTYGTGGFFGEGKAKSLTDAQALTEFRNEVSYIYSSSKKNSYMTDRSACLLITAGGLYANIAFPYNGDAPIVAVGNNAMNALINDRYELITSNNINSYLGIGVNQSWKDMTSQRKIGVQYVNTTSRAIVVSIATQAVRSSSAKLIVNGITMGSLPSSPLAAQVTAIVPSKGSYTLTGGSIDTWSELR